MSPEPQPASEAPRTPASAIGRLRADVRRTLAISREKLVVILFAISIAVAAFFVMQPRIEISAGSPPDKARDILTPFVIANGGFFTVRDLHLQCVARSIAFEQAGAAAADAINSSVLHVTTAAAASLKPGEKLAVACSKGFESEARLLHADVDVNVCLKPYPRIDYISLVHFRYVGERESDGSLRWSRREPLRNSIRWMVTEKQPEECQWAE
jgi:hypothetical protein